MAQVLSREMRGRDLELQQGGVDTTLMGGWGTSSERREAAKLLIASGARGPAVPKLLGMLVDEPAGDPAEIDELDQQAITDPEFPALVLPGSVGFPQRALAAEKRGNYRMALFHAEVSDPKRLCGTYPGHSDSCGDFTVAYYKLRCDIEPDAQWKAMIEAMPGTPSANFAYMAHTTQNFDRMLAAARAAHRERELAEWLRALQQRYDALALSSPPPDPTKGNIDYRRIAVVIGGYVLDLERPGSGGRSRRLRTPHHAGASRTNAPARRGARDAHRAAYAVA